MWSKEGELKQVVSRWHGQLLNAKSAAKLHEEQQAFLRRALEEGKTQYQNFLNDYSETNKPFFELFNEHLALVKVGYYLNEPKIFQRKQAALYELIHSDDSIPDHLKLFFEFLIGLARFDLAVQMQYLFMQSEGLVQGDFTDHVSNDSLPFFTRLNAIGKLLTKINAQIQQVFINKGKSEEFMLHTNAFLKHSPLLEELANIIVSMQVIPKDNPGLVTAAQVLHWNGWGGDGTMLNEFFADEWPDLLANCTRKIFSEDKVPRFTGLLSTLTTPIHRYMTDVITAFFSDRNSQETLHFFDFGAGPSAVMVRGALEALNQQGKSLELDTGDICAIVQENEKAFSRRTYYFDGNVNGGCFAEAPSGIIYDAITAGKVLHQLTDSQAMLKSMVRWTKPQGGIFLSLIGRGSKLQYAIVPINTVDREGWVPEYPFWELAVKCGVKVKFPYPLSKVAVREPSELIAQPVWHCLSYIVVETAPDVLAELKDKHENHKVAEADALLEKQGYGIELFYQRMNKHGVKLNLDEKYI